jgi:tetrahydromethanopterin S-methyltransferase subunit G
MTIGFFANEGVDVFFGKIFGIGLTAIFGLITGLILIALLDSLFAFLS